MEIIVDRNLWIKIQAAKKGANISISSKLRPHVGEKITFVFEDKTTSLQLDGICELAHSNLLLFGAAYREKK